MKKKLIALSLISFGAPVISGYALAQSNVTLYGALDAGVRYTTNAGNYLHQNADKSQLAANSGGLIAPHFGIKGTEDLGGGTLAIFNLESGFNIGNGAINSNSDNRTFSAHARQAYVGLSDKAFGKITLGRQNTVGFDVAKNFDPSNFINQSGITYDLTGSIDGLQGNKRSNATVKYTGSWDNLSLYGSLKPGNQIGSFNKGNAYALGVVYKTGMTTLGSSFSTISHDRHASELATEAIASGRSNIFNIGASHQVGASTFRIGYAKSDIPSVTFTNNNSSQINIPKQTFHNIGLGVKHQASPKLDLTFATYAQFKNTSTQHSSKGYKYLLGANYKMSNRTSLYTYVDYSHNHLDEAGGNRKRNRAGFMSGVTHSF